MTERRNDYPVDILLATYNGSAYLGQMLDSIIQQTWTSWRILVSDDCSTDGTLEILDRYERKMPGKIQIVSEGSRYGGAKENFVHLIRSSTGPYAAFCDQDDAWYPNKLELLMGEMLKKESENGKETPQLVFSDLEITDENLEVTAPSYYSYSHVDPESLTLPGVLAQNQIPGCAMLLNRSLLAKAAECTRVQDIVMHDWWVVLVALCMGRTSLVARPLASYRQHPFNTVGARSYSVFDRDIRELAAASAGFLDRQHECYMQRSRQASAFLDTYQAELSEAQAGVVLGYVRMLEESGAARAFRCFRGRYWQKGAQRKMRQLVYLLSPRPCISDGEM